ncbi:MAG: acyltransferase family protein [Candidatus Thorarchaeota archaeon]
MVEEFEPNLIGELKLQTEKAKQEYFQIDILKTIMIFLVIFDHTIPWLYKNFMGVVLWERISIPVFLVIMGFNMGLSFQHEGEKSLLKLYSWNYFKKKFWRYIRPYIILYIFSSLIAYIIKGPEAFTQFQDNFFFEHLFLGILPFWGPGNWFLPVLFISILIMPSLYKGFSGKWIWSALTLVICYVIEIATYLFLYFGFYQNPFPTWDSYYTWLYFRLTIGITPFSMLSAIGLGFWISRNPKLFAKQNLLIWLLFPISFFYLFQRAFLVNYLSLVPPFQYLIGDYHLFVFPYSAIIVLLTINLVNKKGSDLLSRGIRVISKSTYHILLTQILYFSVVISLYGDHYSASIFGINPDNFFINLVYLVINWVICIPFGILWWYFEFLIREYFKKRKRIS